MELEHQLPILGAIACGCCETGEPTREGSGKIYGCHERSTVFTHREEQVLKRIRELGLKAKELGAELKRLEAAEPVDLPSRQKVMEELESLRQSRIALEAERVAAAEERMRLLGHA